MLNKIPTAEEFFKEFDLNKAPIKYSSEEGYAYLAGKRDAYKKAIEFAKLHVKAALETAAERVKLRHDYFDEDICSRKELRELENKSFHFARTDQDGCLYAVDKVSLNKDSILNSYPETNIV
jgi:hypothetical protein